nr:unnamed protein product [Digitaria exilis]
MVRASGKSRRHTEGRDLHDCHEGIISGFSSSFRKRYYGELVKNSRNHAVRRRTPRIPVVAPADRNRIDEATPVIGNINNTTKRKYGAIDSDCAIVPTNEYSPDRSSGITEANKAGQDHTFLEAKGTEDKVICQQKLKKTRIQQPMEEIQTVKVEHETMASEDRNKLVDSPNNHHEPSNIISEDDMLVLDVLNSLVNAPSKMLKIEFNVPSGSHGKTDSAVSDRREEGHPTIGQSKQGKPVGKSSASKTRNRRHKKLLGAEI